MKHMLLRHLTMCIALCCIAGCPPLYQQRQEVVDRVEATATELKNTRIEIIWRSDNNVGNCFVAVHTRHSLHASGGRQTWWEINFVETSEYGLQKLYEWAAKRG